MSAYIDWSAHQRRRRKTPGGARRVDAARQDFEKHLGPAHFTHRKLNMALLETGKILERIPIFDGSGRRRFVTGGIILIGIALTHSIAFNAPLKDIVPEGIEATDLLTSPMVIAISVLIVYTVGTIFELFGELFLTRVASGIFWAIQFPVRFIQERGKQKKLDMFDRALIYVVTYIFAVPPLLIFFSFCGFLCVTFYRFDLTHLLSAEEGVVLPKTTKESSRWN